jgi:hypothetical protein
MALTIAETIVRNRELRRRRLAGLREGKSFAQVNVEEEHLRAARGLAAILVPTLRAELAPRLRECFALVAETARGGRAEPAASDSVSANSMKALVAELRSLCAVLPTLAGDVRKRAAAPAPGPAPEPRPEPAEPAVRTRERLPAGLAKELKGIRAEVARLAGLVKKKPREPAGGGYHAIKKLVESLAGEVHAIRGQLAAIDAELGRLRSAPAAAAPPPPPPPVRPPAAEEREEREAAPPAGKGKVPIGDIASMIDHVAQYY